jgi:dolichol-phosphate mannosyltransferase
MKLYVLVPCFNEIKTINKIIQKLIKLKKDIKIILIDDGSTDGTKEFIHKNIKNKIFKFIDLKKNYGKGYAINKAKKFVKRDSIVIIQDADLEYNVKDLKKIFEYFKKNKNIKVIYGSRFIKKKFNQIFLSFNRDIARIIGNKFLTAFSNFFNNQKLTDAHTCYKAFDSNIFKRIKLNENGFSFCPEVNTKISLLKIEIIEIPINYFSRTKEMGKKITFFDAFYAIKAIIKYRFF